MVCQLCEWQMRAHEEVTHPSREDIERQISKTESDLEATEGPLDAEEQNIAAQSHRLLKQARNALNVGDFQGAATLSAKARALLLALRRPYDREKPRVVRISEPASWPRMVTVLNGRRARPEAI